MNEQREKAELIAKTLCDKKGIDVAIIDISPKASFADYFVIASGGRLSTERGVPPGMVSPG